MSTGEAQKQSYGRSYKYVPRRMEPLDVALYLFFPLMVYERKVLIRRPASEEGEPVPNEEGEILPSFTDLIFSSDYSVSQPNQKTYLVEHAMGYVPCPVCGRVIKTEVRDEEFEPSTRAPELSEEVAYEVALAVLAPKLSAMIKSHIVHTHGYMFEHYGYKDAIVVRYISETEVLVYSVSIKEYRCMEDEEEVVGVRGMLEHVVEKHSDPDIYAKVNALLKRAHAISRSLLSLSAIPILGSHRSRFYFPLGVAKRDAWRKTLYWDWFRDWLGMGVVVSGSGRILLVARAMLPRPSRMIFHFPIYKPAVLTIAYKLNPRKFMRLVYKARRFLGMLGADTENLDKIVEYVTGTYAHTSLKPRHAFHIPYSVVEELTEAAEEVGNELQSFVDRDEIEKLLAKMKNLTVRSGGGGGKGNQ